MYILGDLSDVSEVLDWMTDQKNDESIEGIDRQTLFKYIDTKEFLAVVFCKYYLLFFIKCMPSVIKLICELFSFI